MCSAAATCRARSALGPSFITLRRKIGMWMGFRCTGGTAATDDETRRVRTRIVEGNIYSSDGGGGKRRAKRRELSWCHYEARQARVRNDGLLRKECEVWMVTAHHIASISCLGADSRQE